MCEHGWIGTHGSTGHNPKKRFGGSAEPETGRGIRGPGIIYRMLFPLPLPVPVSTVRDRWDWLTIWCTVGAAVLALVAIAFAVVAIRRGDRYAREAQEATVRERRNVFELGVLARLIEICGLSPPGAAQVLQGLLAVLPEEDLSGIRAEAAQGRVPSNEALTPFMPEYLEAVRRRLGGSTIGAMPQPWRWRKRRRGQRA